jgi:restriction endonuclease S subunit
MQTSILAIGIKRGGTVHSLQSRFLHELPIPLPPLNTQSRIADVVEAEWSLVESNRKLIEIFEAKIKAKLDEIWGTNANESAVRESPISQNEPAMDLSEPRGVGLADSSSSG